MACAHQFIASDYEDYDKCSVCCSLRHKDPYKPHQVYEKNYWSADQDHPLPAEQVYNIDVHTENGVTKNQFILDLLPDLETSLEIGCAPGSTMNAMLRTGKTKRAIGVDVDRSYENDIRAIAGYPVELIFGYFPEATRLLPPKSVNCVLGLDVFEHSFEPELFLLECNRLLDNDGYLVLMLPLANDDGTLSEPRMRHREHPYLWSLRGMEGMLVEAGFRWTLVDKWCDGHDVIVAIKK